ncbi:D-3-phosphoglycerate dehydrogenase [Psittacicella melopsittaci]|uniref:D-3-phosphoglycerate dehydrogenase n=1 Tax=Psittacicella melopsittaci TaxID=2028576 RepID=A0A3A1Y623_9GAMM|nr:phosphoglycerate dehydrogenase [Psittacicella melopsittaci]RIY32730.1 D-3-phosphoglycerate dehydrogenase [Psittacicella melopsittaci]
MSKVSLDKNKIKFVLLEGVDPLTLETLNNAGYYNIDYHKKALEGEELLAAIKDAHFIGIRSRTHLTREVLAHAEKLIAIGCFCIGTNQVDLEAAAELGVVVFNAPFSNTRSVAEMVLGEMLLLYRNLAQANAEVHRGVWNKSASNANEVRGKTLGIIGYGHIGSQLSVLAEAIGLKVIFFDIENKLPMGNATQVGSLEELVKTADIVSLHVPENESTINMINEQLLSKFKHGAVLINAARGRVVDIDAAVTHLRSGLLRGAAFDVFPEEPKGAGQEFISPLREFDNVILTPHVGGSTAEAQANIGAEVASKFIKYSDNGSTATAVNFPEVTLPEHSNAIRLLHIHHNKPGVLNAINQVFVKNNINIAGQFLSTNANIGYVVIDVNTDSKTVGELASELRDIPGTVKVRLLF